MALEDGTSKMPDQRPSWGLKFLKTVTPKGRQALEQVLEAYAPYATKELYADPAKRLHLAKETHRTMKEAMIGIRMGLRRRFINNGVLSKSHFAIMRELQREMSRKYEELGFKALSFSEAFIFNELNERITSWLLTHIALEESRHRKLTEKAKNPSIRRKVHEEWFWTLDNPESLRCMDPSIAEFLKNQHNQYESIRQSWIPFLQGAFGQFQNPHKWPLQKLKEENDRTGNLLAGKQVRTLDSCQIEEDTSLLGDNCPLTFQFIPIDDQNLGSFHCNMAQVDIFEPKMGRFFREDEEAQKGLKPYLDINPEGLRRDIVIQIGRFPTVFAGRFDGEIRGLTNWQESLRLINPLNYELLRRAIIWELAQLTCSRHTLQEMFGDVFAPREKTVRTSLPKTTEDEPEDGQDDSKERPVSPVTIRRYPRDLTDQSPEALAKAIIAAMEDGAVSDIGVDEEDEEEIIPPEDVEEAVNDTLDRVKRRAGPITAHRRLGRMIRQVKIAPDGQETVTVKATKPSQKAVEEALRAGKELRRGGEFWKIGKVIEPDKVDAFLEKLREELRARGEDNNIQTLDDLATRYPDDFVIRHETWVSRGFRGNPNDEDAIRTIVAEVKDGNPLGHVKTIA